MLRHPLLANRPATSRTPFIGDVAPSSLMLPELPVGDIDETGDTEYEFGDLEGDIEYIDEGDLELGAPKRKRIKAGRLANKLATKTASPAQKQAARALPAKSPKVARSVNSAAKVRALAQNRTTEYEFVIGGRFVATDLGVNSRLRPSEVDALKAAIHLSTPFAPKVFAFDGSNVFNVESHLFATIGADKIYYTGLLITLAASTLNINQGAVITITRSFGTINSVPQQVISTIELDSGVSAVELLVLNGIIVAGKPRFWAPIVAGNATATAYTTVITGLPPYYTATARFLQPGDHQVEKFLSSL